MKTKTKIEDINVLRITDAQFSLVLTALGNLKFEYEQVVLDHECGMGHREQLMLDAIALEKLIKQVSAQVDKKYSARRGS